MIVAAAVISSPCSREDLAGSSWQACSCWRRAPTSGTVSTYARAGRSSSGSWVSSFFGRLPLALLPTMPGVALGAIGVVWFDLRERAMLGDGGANLLGFTVGLGLYVVLHGWGVALDGRRSRSSLNVLAETVTLSRVIDAIPPLRWFDDLGAASPARERRGARQLRGTMTDGSSERSARLASRGENATRSSSSSRAESPPDSARASPPPPSAASSSPAASRSPSRSSTRTSTSTRAR